jgi:hypothetical protein
MKTVQGQSIIRYVIVECESTKITKPEEKNKK